MVAKFGFRQTVGLLWRPLRRNCLGLGVSVLYLQLESERISPDPDFVLPGEVDADGGTCGLCLPVRDPMSYRHVNYRWHPIGSSQFSALALASWSVLVVVYGSCGHCAGRNRVRNGW